jgi:glutathione synthase/RimK-type ligase-like ATP-grasp enzyme
VAKDLLFIFFRLKYFPDNYSLCRLWEKPRNEWIYYYGSIYDPLQRSRLRKKVLPIKYRIIYDDKRLCNQLCQANKIPVPEQYGIIDSMDFESFVKELIATNPKRKLIVKPIAGRGGKDIYIVSLKHQNLIVQGVKQEVNLKNFTLPLRSVVELFINQHKSLQQFSYSVNTIRMVTLMTSCGKVVVVGALIRFGVAGAIIDNTSQGGVKVGIDLDTGQLNKTGCDKKGRLYERHPTSLISFNKFRIPHWERVIALAKKVQSALPYNRLIGQDIAILPDGPVIIELNAEYDNVGLEQACGPILADLKVLKAFFEYDLLINKHQKELFRRSKPKALTQ